LSCDKHKLDCKNWIARTALRVTPPFGAVKKRAPHAGLHPVPGDLDRLMSGTDAPCVVHAQPKFGLAPLHLSATPSKQSTNVAAQ
jgi:hypothetical protein